jgi:hypothetical protein
LQVFTISEFVAVTPSGARVSLGVRQVEDGWIVFSGETALIKCSDSASATTYTQKIIDCFEDASLATAGDTSIVDAEIVEPDEIIPPGKN